MNWQLQEAKNKLSKVVEQARKSGPQIITVWGKDAAVVLSMEDFSKLAGHKDTLLEFFQNSPLRGIDLDIFRDRDMGRDIEL